MRILPALLFTTIALVAMACNEGSMNNSESTPEELVGTWSLEGIESPNPVLADKSFDQMEYQEYYEFDDNGSFRKYRNDGAEATGTISVRNTEEGNYYILTYAEDAPAELISACQQNEESLRMESDKLVNDARMCDRPRYTYTRNTTEQ